MISDAVYDKSHLDIVMGKHWNIASVDFDGWKTENPTTYTSGDRWARPSTSSTVTTPTGEKRTDRDIVQAKRKVGNQIYLVHLTIGNGTVEIMR